MAESFEAGALLGHVYTLPDGLPVRLRLARSSDAPGVRRLLDDERSGLEPGRLVHFDPRRRYVVCATGLVDGRETLLGVGAIRLDDGTAPDLLVVDGRQPQELTDLLRCALESCAEAVTRARAA